jgi:hypothetical protein
MNSYTNNFSSFESPFPFEIQQKFNEKKLSILQSHC